MVGVTVVSRLTFWTATSESARSNSGRAITCVRVNVCVYVIQVSFCKEDNCLPLKKTGFKDINLIECSSDLADINPVENLWHIFIKF